MTVSDSNFAKAGKKLANSDTARAREVISEVAAREPLDLQNEALLIELDSLFYLGDEGFSAEIRDILNVPRGDFQQARQDLAATENGGLVTKAIARTG